MHFNEINLKTKATQFVNSTFSPVIKYVAFPLKVLHKFSSSINLFGCSGRAFNFSALPHAYFIPVIWVKRELLLNLPFATAEH